MLAAKNRLPGYRIPELLQRGLKYKSGPFSLYALEAALPDSRIGIVVPVRLSKKANQRNRTKRIIRTALYQNIKTIQGGKDIVIITNTLLTGKKASDIEPLIKNALSTVFP